MSAFDDRAARIEELVSAQLRAALAGHDGGDESLMAAHPDLMPEIELELRKVRLLRSAFGCVDRLETPTRAETAADAQASSLRVRCPDCHTLQCIASDAMASAITCSSCGSRFSLLGDDTGADASTSASRRVAHFELLARLGSGGFGAVWKARDTQLDRLVALKLPRRGQLSAAEAELFLREARAAAQLHHSGIVSIHEVGRDGNSVYIVSELIEGVSLAEWLVDQRMSAREAAELCLKIAEALAHAHQHGVIHRDLKPANVLLDAEGRPHITDFGLARREAGEVTMTVDGQLVGTPAYMSPEQARGDSHTSDARSDIYALGVMLYELLTGEVPFRGTTATLLHQVIHNEPPSARRLNPRIPRDLETIALKCLEKDPARRYVTAQAVADDLKRYLRGEPIVARPVSRTERAWRWCKRRPAVAGLGSLAAALVVILAVAASLVAWRETKRRHAAVAQQRLLRHQVYGLDMDAAMRAWQEAIVPRVEEILDHWQPVAGQEDLRGFEWYYFWRNCQRGKACPTYRHTIGFEDNPAFTADGRHLAVLEGPTYVLLDAATATPVLREELPTRNMNATELSPNGSLVATGGEQEGRPVVRLWRLIPERAELTLEGPFAEVRTLLFSPDSTLLAGACADRTIQFWDASSGKRVSTLDASTLDGSVPIDRLEILAISPDHRLLATVVDWTRPVIWDIPQNRQFRELAGHGANSDSAAFSPDGTLLATGGWDNTVKLWNVANGALLRTLSGHRDWVKRVAFSADGSMLGSSSDDNTVRLWKMPSGQEIETLQGHADNVECLALAPDNSTLASDCNSEGATKFWRLDEVDQTPVLAGHGIHINAVAISSDEHFVASGDIDGEIRIWDAHYGRQLYVLAELKDAVTRNTVQSIALSPISEWLASCHETNTVTIWQTASWQMAKRISTQSTPVMVVFSADAREMIVSSDDGVISTYRVGTFEEVHRFKAGDAGPTYVAISVDGRLLATGHKSGALSLWDKRTYQLLGSLPHLPQAILHVAFSSDGRLLASSSDGGEIRLWDVATRQAYGQPMKHLAAALRVKFLPDGKTLASCSADHTIGLWDVETCTRRGTLSGTEGWVRDLAVSRSGRLLASAGGDMKVRLWRAASPLEVAAAEGH